MDELKKLLGDLYDQVMAKLGKQTLALVPEGQKAFLHKENETPVISNNGEWIPKDKFKEKTDEIKTLETQIADLNKDLGKLKKSLADNSDATTTIQKLQDDIKAKGEEMEALKKQYADKEILDKKRNTLTELLKNGVLIDGKKHFAKHPELLVKAEFDLSKVEIDSDGKIKNAEELIKPIKEKYADQFGVQAKQGEDVNLGEIPDEYREKNPFSNKTLNIAKQVELMRDPTKKKLVETLQAAAN